MKTYCLKCKTNTDIIDSKMFKKKKINYAIKM